MNVEAVRKHIAQQARHRCGYCQTHREGQWHSADPRTRYPPSCRRRDEEENLWVSCRLCNESKGVRTEAIDPPTDNMAPLYNPRTQNWAQHFAWTDDGTEIVGLTDVGRATVDALSLNAEFRVRSRAIWVEAGYHPPE